MKHLLIILSLTGILLQTFYSGIILTNYVVNKDFISKNLCENRDKPMLHCNGKCHLRKQLAEQEKKQNIPFQSLKEKLEISISSEKMIAEFSASAEKTTNVFYYSFFIPKASLNSIFHPPRIA